MDYRDEQESIDLDDGFYLRVGILLGILFTAYGERK
jgi:hypothetical protein